MKIIKESDDNPLVALTIRLPKGILEQVTTEADKHDVSRQRLIAAILEKALQDKHLELKIKD